MSKVKSTYIKELEEMVRHSKDVMQRYIGESITYDWDERFKLVNIENGAEYGFVILDNALDGRLKTLDLTSEELNTLGFQRWDEESNLYLIPIWMTKFIQQDIEVTSFMGEKKTLAKADKDHRYGCIAYGVKPTEGTDEDGTV